MKMKIAMNYVFLLFVVMIPFVSSAQEEVDEVITKDTTSYEEPLILPKNNDLFNFRLVLTLPNAIANKSFKKSFIGIYQVEGGLKMALYKGVFIGVSFSTNSFKIDRDVIIDYKTVVNINDKTPTLTSYNAGISLGGQWYLGEQNRMKLSADVLAGQSSLKYANFVCKDSSKNIGVTNLKAPYFSLSTEFYFLVQPNWGIGPSISYTIVQNSFDPYELCLDDWSTFPTNNSGVTQYINWGLVFYYSFLSK